MNEPLNLILDKRAFLRWAEGREGRFELKGNRVEMMRGGTKSHARIAAALSARLDRWAVTTADLAVEIGEDVRYPTCSSRRSTTRATLCRQPAPF